MSGNFLYDVFVSYNQKDKKIIHALAKRLKQDGLRVWLDAWEIHPGDMISLRIQQGLEMSQTLIMCMSPAYFESEWGALEHHTLLFRDPTNVECRLIPLLIADCTIPHMISHFAHIDWRKQSDEDYNKLLFACRGQEKPFVTHVIYPAIPIPDKNFHCYRFGNIEIPAMPIVGSPETPFSACEIDIKFRPQLIQDRPSYPQALKDATDYLVEQCQLRFDIKRFVDNTLIRLDDVTQYAEDEKNQRGGLLLEFSLTTYRNLLATNASLDCRVIPRLKSGSRFADNQTLREAFGNPPYEDLSMSIFGNSPGVEVILISRNSSQVPNDQMIIRRRSNKVHIYRGHYQASASGYISLAHRDSNNLPNPFVTAIAEAREEIADSLSLSPEDFKLIGVALHWHGLYPAFYGYIETGLSVQELLGDFKRDSFEGYLFAIPFTPMSVLSHIATEKWTAISALAAISSVLAFFPAVEAKRVANKLPVKTASDFLSTIEGN